MMMGLIRNTFFGVPVEALSRRDIFFRVRTSLRKHSFLRIATVGPEFLLRARRSKKFRANLLMADLRVADGFGITFAGWIYGKHIPRFPGADLLHGILKEAERRNLSTFLAIRKDGLSSFDEIRTTLLKEYPRLKVTGEEFALPINNQQSTINTSIVFCNFGAPDQEYFLESLRGRSESVRLVMGVGGAFDFLTGKLPRAPRVFRAIGLEWLWRLFLQPSRWKRIWRAVAVFPVIMITEFFRMRAMMIFLKEATLKDIPVLIDIERSVAGTRLYLPIVDEKEWIEEFQKNTVFLIERNDEIVGNASFEKRDDGSVYISGLAIMPGFQGQGIGRYVMNALLNEKLRDEKRITLVTHPNNLPALALYQSFGFVIGERRENCFGDGEPRVELILER